MQFEFGCEVGVQAFPDAHWDMILVGSSALS
jgi:hypothetical protein